jgi:4-hydroxy-tetrahydrodipicolinate synthase
MVDHNTWLVGYIADLPTPFDENDAVDLRSLRLLCERQIAAGATALLVCETTGEASTLTHDEHGDIVAETVEVAQGSLPVIAGIASNSTSEAVALAEQAEAAGADAIMAVVPYYNKPMQSGLYAHFTAIADSTRLPIIIHDCPSRTARGMSDDTVVRLSESKQIIGIRDDAHDITRPLRLRSLVRKGFRLMSGDDATSLAYLVCGGDGCISLAANVAPVLCQNLYQNLKCGDMNAARTAAVRLARLAAVLNMSDTPAPLKYALNMLGLASPRVRLPMIEVDDVAKVSIAHALTELCTQGSRTASIATA